MADEFVTLTSDDTPTPPAPPPTTPAMPKVVYVVDSSRATFGELWRDTHSPVVLISKLLRIRVPGSVNDPNVETLAPFEIAESALPPDVRELMHPAMWQLHALGFDLVAVH